MLRLFGRNPVIFERGTGVGYPSKVRVALVAVEDLTVWAPSWDGCPFQAPFASGLEAGGKAGLWDGKTKERVVLSPGDTVRAWVGLDVKVPDKGRVGILTVPISSDVIGSWSELHFPVGWAPRPSPGPGSSRLG